MNAAIKDKWITALRSGKYVQGRAELHNRDNNTFCCLGVLCELAAEARVIPPGKPMDGKTYLTAYGENTNTATLPKEVQAWAGIDAWGHFYHTDEDRGRALTSMNDSGSTFTDIASTIERYM